MKNTKLLVNKSPCLRNSAQYDQGYYDKLTGSRRLQFETVNN